jgi:3-methyladenine DNA glycosylase AlkD
VATRAKSTRTKARPATAASPVKRDTGKELAYALKWMKRRGSKRNRDGMARYGITAKKVFGISVVDLRKLAKDLGRSHALARALWKTEWHEARMLAAMVGEPARVTPAEMDRWSKAFDNWAVCDTLTFVLWDRTPHAWPKVREWSRRKEEFVKRAGFALLASLTVHDKAAPDERYLEGLVLIEREAPDERNFVKKAVNWALRSIGKRSPALNREAVAVAKRLADAETRAARWVGTDALRELTSESVQQRLARRASRVERAKS